MTQQHTLQVAVCGAHMSGLPLNSQLTALGGTLVAKTATAPCYRLYHLAQFQPPRPGLLRVAHEGVAIALEVWALPLSAYGIFVAGIPAPLGIGTLELASHVWVQGFLCEAYATTQAEDISGYGGWREFLKTTQS